MKIFFTLRDQIKPCCIFVASVKAHHAVLHICNIGLPKDNFNKLVNPVRY